MKKFVKIAVVLCILILIIVASIIFVKNSKKIKYELFRPVPVSKEVCKANREKLGIVYCPVENDYWAGAMLKCEQEGKRLPRIIDILEVAKGVYPENAEELSGKPMSEYSVKIYPENIFDTPLEDFKADLSFGNDFAVSFFLMPSDSYFGYPQAYMAKFKSDWFGIGVENDNRQMFSNFSRDQSSQIDNTWAYCVQK